MKKHILVWPANTEIGLEIGRALQNQKHFEVTGASSGPGPADFVFDWSHWHDAPNVSAPDAAERLKIICNELDIDFVYPAHDQAAVVCADAGVPYIGAPPETVRMCRSKRATYEAVNAKLANVVPTAYPFENEGARSYAKPDIGQGGKANTPYCWNDKVVCDYLPGPEYTIDCFTDRYGVLRFAGARKRNRTANGICVESEKSNLAFRPQAKAISDAFNMRGAWFFQMKEDKDGVPTLLEISVRPAGSSGFHRANGINLPLLACYDSCGIDVDVMSDNICTTAYRSLQTHYSVDIEFEKVYCDYDDTLYGPDGVNTKMLSVLARFANEGKDIAFLTRSVIDEPIVSIFLGANWCYVPKGRGKSAHILSLPCGQIFIDDSHAERKEVHESTGIPVFSPEQAISIWGN